MYHLGANVAEALLVTLGVIGQRLMERRIQWNGAAFARFGLTAAY
jgi:hypothetical protein